MSGPIDLPCNYSRPEIRPAGDSAVLVVLGERMDPVVNRRIHQLAWAISANPLPGTGETVPGYATLLVHYDPLLISYSQAAAWLENLDPAAVVNVDPPRRVEIPVCYGGEYGPDLAFVAQHNHLSEAEVIRIHSAREYPVYLMGFTPGFPYLGGMDPAIAAPRLNTPRSRIPGGSVGIAGEQTGIYPVDSPGGWRIIGRTDLRLFDITSEPPFLLAPGDVVSFMPVHDLKG